MGLRVPYIQTNPHGDFLGKSSQFYDGWGFPVYGWKYSFSPPGDHEPTGVSETTELDAIWFVNGL